FLLLGQQVDHREQGLRIELGRIGAFHAGYRTGELDHRYLHAETDAEVRDLVLPRISGRFDLAFDAALSETAGDQDPVNAFEQRRVEVLRVDQVTLDLHPVVDRAVFERFHHRLVRIGELDVLADQSDPDG